MRLNVAKSDANDLVFDFVSVSGKDLPGRINAVRFHFAEGKVVETWSTTDKDEYLSLSYDAK